MFFVHQLEEAYVQKSIVIAATHETAIVCPSGHSKTVLCSDGEHRSVVGSIGEREREEGLGKVRRGRGRRRGRRVG